MMRMKAVFYGAVLSLALAACGPQATPTAPEPLASVPSTQEAGDTPTEQEATALPPATGSDSSGEPDQTGQIQIIGGDEQALRDFIGRYISPGYPGAPVSDTLILIGGLPEDLPFPLAIPEDAVVLGSVVQEPPFGITIIADTQLSAEEVTAFYAGALSGDDWQEATNYGPTGGFVTQPAQGATYCYGDDEASLNFSAMELPDGGTDLRLYIQIIEDGLYGPCQQVPYEDPAAGLIPLLIAPEGVQMQATGGGGGGGGASYEQSMTAVLLTDMSPRALAEHFAAQLVEAGWVLQVEDSGEGAAWSNWLVTDEDGDVWSGLLMIIATSEEPARRFALVRVESQP